MAVALKVKVDFLLLSIDDFICKQKKHTNYAVFVLQNRSEYLDVILKETDSVVPYQMTKDLFEIPTTLLLKVKKLLS